MSTENEFEQCKFPKRLTEDQLLEVFFVFGGARTLTEGKPMTYWSDVFHWLKKRWPSVIACESYSYVSLHWRENESPARDMAVLMEVWYHTKRIREKHDDK